LAQDLAHWFGQDLNVAASGDLLTVDGTVKGQQRVLRRLLTNPGDYIWHPNYGAGLASKIGQPFDAASCAALVKAQMFLEPSVARTPPPVINVSQITNGLFVSIAYTDAATGSPVALSFSVTPPGS
jgi:phage baseplate assembly protein W